MAIMKYVKCLPVCGRDLRFQELSEVSREYFISLAESGVRMPIGADLVLREKTDPESIMLDGERLGEVIVEAADRFDTPLAFVVMDLTVEKAAILGALGVDSDSISTYHFTTRPDAAAMEQAMSGLDNAHLEARRQALSYVSRNTDLVPVGMSIGPFSLATKLLADPITPVYLAGMGMTAEEDDSVGIAEGVLELATRFVLASIESQIKAGAEAIFIAEPAANKVYISPKQMAEDGHAFDLFAQQPNLLIKDLLERAGVDLIFHCCGELTDDMVRKFGELRPAMLSLGSSRVLWEDAALVPDDVVLYGNLPSKRFYSDDLISVREVEEMSCELIDKMAKTGQPFILGTECDVLSVEGCEKSIGDKVSAIVHCTCAHHPSLVAAG